MLDFTIHPCKGRWWNGSNYLVLQEQFLDVQMAVVDRVFCVLYFIIVGLNVDCFFIDLSIRLKKYVIYRVTKLRKGIARVVVIQYPVMGMAWRSYTLLSLS